MSVSRILRVGVALLFGMLACLWFFGLRMEVRDEPSLAGSLETLSLEHAGRLRTSLVYRPSRPAESPALILVFHGSMGDSVQARTFFAYDFEELAEEHGFFVAYPDGFDRHWNGCRKDGPYEANRLNVDDVGFSLALVNALVASEGIDRESLFATGLSNGGQMALRLALEAPQAFRAVASVIASQPAPENMGCQPAGLPISVAFLNGTEDPMNPFEGGNVSLYGLWGNRGEVWSTWASAEYWRDLAGATGEGEQRWLDDSQPDDGSRIEEISWRVEGKPWVQMLNVHGGGHTVPHPKQSMPRLLGRTNHDHSAAELLWRFFSEVPPL